MSDGAGPETYALGNGDLYGVFMDRRIRAEGGPGNGSLFLYELSGRVDTDDLRQRLDRLLETCPVLGAGLRSWPLYRWVPVPGHRIPLEIVEWSGDAQGLFNTWYDKPFRPLSEPSFQVVCAPGDDRSWLLLRWLHPLMDAPGADRLVRLLDGEDPAAFRLHDVPPTLPRRGRGSLGWLVVAVHNFMLRHVVRSIPPPRQLRLPRRASPASELLVHTFDRAETQAIDGRVAEVAGPLGANHFFMAAAFLAAAHHIGGGGFTKLLIPCPVNLRPRAWKGPIFSNYFTSVLVMVPKRKLDTLANAVAAVRDRFRVALKRREDAAAFWMISLARYLPYPLYLLLMLGPTARDPASLYYSNVELDAGRDGTLLGMPLHRFLAASHVLRPPGAAVVFCRCAGRLTVEVPQRGYDGAQALLDHVVGVLRGEVDGAA